MTAERNFRLFGKGELAKEETAQLKLVIRIMTEARQLNQERQQLLRRRTAIEQLYARREEWPFEAILFQLGQASQKARRQTLGKGCD